VVYKDKIITFPLFNICYPQNLARNLARFWNNQIKEWAVFLKEENIMLNL
jgi:hypothetical protein